MTKRRFIAGAVCPRCSSMDSTFVFREEKVDVRACTDCDFEERVNIDPTVEELPTRVNQTVDETVIEIQQVRIIDNNDNEK